MTDISIPPGVSVGATPAERPNRWAASSQIRWHDGVLKAIGGWQRISQNPLASPVRRILAVRDNVDIKRVALGQDAALTIYDGGTFFDATPTDFVAAGTGGANGYGIGPYGLETYGTPRSVGDPSFLRANTWSLDSWGEQVLALAASDGRLLRWDPQHPGDKATAVPGAPTGARAMAVLGEQRFCFLIGGSGARSRTVAWSAREDYTAWTPTATNNAGSYSLDSDGLLYGCAEVREGLLVFSDSDVWLLNYIGGDFVFGKQKVGTTSLLSPHAVATFGGRAAWLGSSSFYLYEAGQVRPLPCDVSAHVFNDINLDASTLYAHGADNGLFAEVTWYYCSAKSTTPDRYVTWSYQDNIWWFGTLSRTASCPAGVNRAHPLMAGGDGHIYQHEDGVTAAGASRIGDIWIESAAIAPGGQSRVQRMQLDGGVPNASKVTVTARATRDGGDVVYGPFTPNPDGRTPCRAGGQDLRVKIEATTDDPNWTVGRFSADVTQIGNR